jgi:pescadillo protein
LATEEPEEEVDKVEEVPKHVKDAEEAKEAKELAKIMMSKREKKLYDKIQFGKKRKQEEVKKLQKKKLSAKKN